MKTYTYIIGSFVSASVLFLGTLNRLFAQQFEEVISLTDLNDEQGQPADDYDGNLNSLLQIGDGEYLGTMKGGVFRLDKNGLISKLADPPGLDSILSFNATNGYVYGYSKSDATGHGNIFRLKKNGSGLEILATFGGTSGTNLGSNPTCLLQSPNGYLFGITTSGGINNLGTVFTLSPSGQIETLVNFSGTSGNFIGANPNNLLWGNDGNLYGTTVSGGSEDNGTIFRLESNAGFSFSIVSEFGTGAGHIAGRQPVSLVESTPGHFVGTTRLGGASGRGTLYQFDTFGDKNTIKEFDTTAGSPIHNLIKSPNGDVFGLLSSEPGYVFHVDSNFIYEIYCEFTDSRTLTNRWYDESLEKFPIFYANNSIYGTLGKTIDSWGPSAFIYRITNKNTFNIISNPSFDDDNDVFEYGINASIFLSDNTEKLLGSSFSYTIPISPDPIELARGRIFSITDNSVNWGTGGTQTPTTLARNPVAGIAIDREGRILGSTKFGGLGAGSLFNLTPSGNLTTIANFNHYFYGGPDSGSRPVASLTPATDGSIFGITSMSDPDNVHYVEPPRPDAFKLNADLTFSWKRQLTIYNYNSEDEDPYSFEGFGEYDANSLNNWSGFTLSSDSFLYGRGFNNRILKLSTSGDIIEFGSPDILLNGQGKLLEIGQGSSRRFLGVSSGRGTYVTQQPATPVGKIFTMTPEGAFTVLADFSESWTSAGGWQGKTFAAKSGTFTVSFDLKPNGSSVDTVTGLASGVADEFSDLACIVRMNTSGYFDVRNGGGYQANFHEFYTNGRTYHVEMTVNTADHTYSVRVNGTMIAANYAFRTEQAGVASLDHFALTAVAGSHLVSGVSLFPSTVGRMPLSGLIAGSDGWYYGTASEGGTYDKGTVYRMSAAGVLEKVADFNGANGSGPVCELLEHSDGWFYGVTPSGGAADLGTVFRVSRTGTIETLFDFANDPLDSKPYGTLCMGPDGAMYGTASGSGDGYGSVFRLVFPGAPAVYPLDATADGTDSALFHCKFNARGSATTTRLEVGSDGTTFPTIYNLSPLLTGYRTSELAKRLTGLTRGVTYYYRFRATSSAGETVGPIQTYDTTGPPVAAVLDATQLTGGSAQANGTVRAGNAPTSVAVEYGTDGVSFPNAVSATPALVNGSNEIPVKADLSGLSNGTTYHYRLKAENEFGLVYSPVMDFQTLSRPVVAVTGAFPVATASVRVEGTVDPRGLQTGVFFEYGTDGVTFPNSVAATPAMVEGDDLTPVSTVLSNLQQGVAYHYRLKAISAGGDRVSTAGTFELDNLSGFTRVSPSAPESAGGFLLVNIDPTLPAPLVPGWRFVGEKSWRPVGLPAAGLVLGSRFIEFKPLPGYNQPPRETVALTSTAPFASLTRIYYEASSDGSGSGGSLTVTLKPDSALPLARWRFLGQTEAADWKTSGTTVNGLAAGAYLIECSDASTLGLTTPQPGNVVVADGGSVSVTLTYGTPAAESGQAPSLIPFETATSSDSQNLPYAHVGQIRSDSGLASGFVVRPRVVATAAHVVFEDRFDALGDPEYVTGLQWLFQQDAGGHEPIPQTPRGFYVLDGYAAARNKPGVVPGQGTQESQHYDVAALYFLGEDAGRGGYSGFLASDSADNEYLLSDDDKMLVGYPVDGIVPALQGRLHATPPINALFTRTAGEVIAGTPFRTYRTTSVRSSGGASGGPLCVRLDSGVWYPAAVYLGGSGQTIVRAIDSTVVELFNRAETSANGGDNNTGGGITHSGTRNLPGSDSGALTVNIKPAGAVAAGARWRLKGDPIYRFDDDRLGGINPGSYKLQLLTVPGYQTPVIESIRINGGEEKLIEFTYAEEVPKPSITSAGSALATRGKSFTYQIICSPAADSFTLSGDLPSGLSFNTSTGRISGTPLETGVFSLTLGAVNAGGTGTRTLLITSRPNIPNQSANLTQGLSASYQIQSSESGSPQAEHEADELPAGLTLTPSSGSISGTPAQTGTYSSLITVSNNGASASAILTLTVSPGGITLWRQQRFGTTTNTGPASDTADPDGDGRSNREEYAADTDPNNGSDFLHPTSITRTSGAFTVTIKGRAQRTYQLQRANTPGATSWTTVASTPAPLPADNPALTLSDTSPPLGNAFYRIQVSAP